MKKSLKIIVPLMVGLLMAWSLTRKVEWDVVLQELQKGIAWGWVVVSVTLALMSHIIRGLRWRLQLRTLGVNPTAHDMAIAVFGNYGLNLALPRVGEVWRCSFVARRYHLPFSTTFGTMVSERLVDMVVAGLMTLAAFLHEREHFAAFMAGSDVGQRILDLLSSPWLWTLAIIAIVVVALFSRYLRHTLVYQYAADFLHNMWLGIKGLKDVPNLWG